MDWNGWGGGGYTQPSDNIKLRKHCTLSNYPFNSGGRDPLSNYPFNSGGRDPLSNYPFNSGGRDPLSNYPFNSGEETHCLIISYSPARAKYTLTDYFRKITGEDNLTACSYSGREKSPEWRWQWRRADLQHFEIFRHGPMIIYTRPPAGGT